LRGVELSTEKRFIANIDSLYPVRIRGIQDTVTGEELTVFDEVVECLNALHEENIQLKQEVEDLKQALIRCAFDGDKQ
jgi:hypothetical protein